MDAEFGDDLFVLSTLLRLFVFSLTELGVESRFDEEADPDEDDEDEEPDDDDKSECCTAAAAANANG